MNYWNTKQIHWHDFSAEDIFIKRNRVSSQFEDEIQTASYKTKSGFVDFLTNGNTRNQSGRMTKRAVGGCVRLHGLKGNYPCAEIDFVKYNINKKYSNGANKWTSPNAIAYITSNHQHGQYKRDPISGDWVMDYDPLVARDDEGYQVHFSANQSQYGGDRRECQEMLDISWAVVDFLVEKVLPCQRNALTMVA